MAKAYRPPDNIPPPVFDEFLNGGFDNDGYQKACERFIKKLRDEAVKNRTGTRNDDLVGEVVRFQVGDGYAQYMVWRTRPLELVHLPLYDEYAVPGAHIRGLRIADVREAIEWARRWASLSERKEA